MYTEGFEQWLKTANKSFSGPMSEWHKSNTELWHDLLAENLEIASENFQRVSEQLKRFARIKKTEDYLTLVRECINEDINAAIENSQKLLHSTMEHVEECMKSATNVHETTMKAASKEREREREK